jgi:Holliday junction DNA helicase RuvA
MIAALRGQILTKNRDGIILMVGGVGYDVFTTRTFLTAASAETEVLLYTYLHVREDQLTLFGFQTIAELRVFKLLLTVSGVGPKTALLVMEKGVEGIQRAVETEDLTFFTGISRLGTKNAQKIIIELKTKLGNGLVADSMLNSGRAEQLVQLQDVLVSMGFTRTEILRALDRIPPELTSVDAKLRFMLKTLGRVL